MTHTKAQLSGAPIAFARRADGQRVGRDGWSHYVVTRGDDRLGDLAFVDGEWVWYRYKEMKGELLHTQLIARAKAKVRTMFGRSFTRQAPR